MLDKLGFLLVSPKFKEIKHIRSFTSKVTKMEGKKISLSVAQVAEVLKCVNTATKGEFYNFLRRGK